MGGAFLGPFVAGLSSTMQRAQEQQTQEAYKKALIEQSKLNTKMLENKLTLAQHEQNVMAAYLKTKGIDVPPVPQVPQQKSPQLAATQPQGLLGRLFGKPQAQPQAPAQPVQQVSAGATPLPQQIAQGQMKGSNAAFMEDYIGKKYLDMPPWREKHEAEGGQVGQKVEVMTPSGPAVIILNKRGEPMNAFSKPPEYGTITQTSPYGDESQLFYPKHQPPMGGVMTKPPAQAIAKAPTSQEEEKLREYEGQIGALNHMIDFAKDPKNEDAFGAYGQFKHNTYQDESLAGGAKRLVIPAPRPEVSAFQVMKQNFINELRHGRFGGALTPQEAAEFQKESIASGDRNQFLATASAVREKVAKHYERMNRDIQQPYGMRQKPSLNLNKPSQNMPEPPSGWRIIPGEKSPDGYPIVTDGKTKKRWGP